MSSYFVEKYGVYREARILSAGGHSAACAQGAGGSVFLDTDDALHLGAVVNGSPIGNGSFYLNGIVPGQSLCLVASALDPILCQAAFFQIELDSMKNLYSASFLKFESTKKEGNYRVKQSVLIFNQLAELKSNAKTFDKIFVTGELSDNPLFLQACADLFSSEMITFDNSVYGAAIGNALSAARKIKETSFEEILSEYFKSTGSKKYIPSPEGQSQMLSQLIAYAKQ